MTQTLKAAWSMAVLRSRILQPRETDTMMTEDQVIAIITTLAAGAPPQEQSEAFTALAITCSKLCEQVLKTQEALNTVREVLENLTKAAEEAGLSSLRDRVSELEDEARSRGSHL